MPHLGRNRVEPGMKQHRQPQLGAPPINGQHPWLIRKKALVIRVQLDAVKPQLPDPLQLLQHIRRIRMHTAVAVQDIVLLLRRPVVDDGLLGGLGGDGQNHALIHAPFP